MKVPIAVLLLTLCVACSSTNWQSRDYCNREFGFCILVPADMESVSTSPPYVFQFASLGEWSVEAVVEPLGDFTYNEACERIGEIAEEQLGAPLKSEQITNSNGLIATNLFGALEGAATKGKYKGRKIDMRTFNYIFQIKQNNLLTISFNFVESAYASKSEIMDDMIGSLDLCRIR